MRNLLALQDLDKKINACKQREVEIPKQKSKFSIHRKRLQNELTEREDALKALVLEQKECEGNIELRQAQIQRYNEQLNTIKKNEEYQALLHEIEREKKQIAIHEERILTIMVEMDDAKEVLEEDTKRIKSETAGIDAECAEIDKELQEAVTHREELEANERDPIVKEVPNTLLSKYDRLCRNYKNGLVVVPIIGEVCSAVTCTYWPRSSMKSWPGTRFTDASTAVDCCIFHRISRTLKPRRVKLNPIPKD